MLYSIIIINYKTPQLTSDCIQSLLKVIPSDSEIIVVDNGSEDDSLQIIENTFGSTIKLISGERNLGFAGGNNLGAKAASGHYLIFLNSDTIIENDFITPCIKILEENQHIGIIAPRLKLADGNFQKAAYGRFPALWKLLTQQTKRELALSDGDYTEVDWVSGCALIIPRELFDKIGGWDENFFLYYEDVDLCRRVHEAGFTCAIAHEADIIHLGGRSADNNSIKQYYYRSQDYYFKKHYGMIISLLIKLFRLPYRLLPKKCI